MKRESSVLFHFQNEWKYSKIVTSCTYFREHCSWLKVIRFHIIDLGVDKRKEGRIERREERRIE